MGSLRAILCQPVLVGCCTRSEAVLLGLIVVAVVTYPAAVARAVPAAPPHWVVVNTDRPLLANGVLLLRSVPGEFGDVELPWVSLSAAGVERPGVLEEVALEGHYRYAVFRPADIMDVPGNYQLQVMSGASAQSKPFVTAASQPLEPGPLTATVAQRVQVQREGERCCQTSQSPSPLTGVAAGACVPTTLRELPSLAFEVTAWPGDSVARQFLYRVQLTDLPALHEPYWLAARDLLQGPFALVTAAESRAEYCYRVEAYNLVTGAITALGEDCQGHALGMLGEGPPSQADIDLALQVQTCVGAPDELREDWCRVNAERCEAPATEADANLCLQGRYVETCALLPQAGMGPGPGSGVSAGTDSSVGGRGGATAGRWAAAGASAGDDASDPRSAGGALGAAGTGVDSAGCSCRARLGPSPGPELLPAFGIALWLAARARRRPRR